jgi:hypothetical protein
MPATRLCDDPWSGTIFRCDRPEPIFRGSWMNPQVERQVKFVTKLSDRMTALGFPPDDPLASAAATAMLKLPALYPAARQIGSNRK